MEQGEYNRRVLGAATLAGKILLASGAEIFRVQETISRMIDHSGVESCSVYVIANGIFCTIAEGTPEQYTSIRHVPSTAIQLDRIAEVNQIAREYCKDLCTLDEVWQRLNECEKPRKRNRLLLVLASGVGAGAFAVLFGGGWCDALAAFVFGLLLELELGCVGAVQKYLQLILGAFTVTALAELCTMTPLPVTLGHMVIGSIMPLVPGTVFTTGIRELFNGDYVSATVHLLDALTSAGCIALGVSGAILLSRMLGGAP